MSWFADRIVQAAAPSVTDEGHWESRPIGLRGAIMNAFNNPTSATGRKMTTLDSLSIPAIYRGIFLLASIPAFLPLKVFKAREGGGADVVRDHHTFRLLYHQPNEWQTSYQWRVAMGMSLHTRGNGYSLLIWNKDGTLKAIHWLHPDRVEVYVDDNGYPIYRVWKSPSKTEEKDAVWISRFEMHHLWVETLNGYTGCTAIEKCRESIALAHGQRETALRLMSNGAMPSGILTLPAGVNAEAKTTAKLNWKEAHAGLGNAGSVIVMPADTSYTQLSLSMQDTQWVSASRFSKEEMATILGLIPDLLTISGGQMGGVTGVEQRFLMSLAMRFDPILVAWEQSIQRDMFIPEELDDVYPRFNRNAMLRTDILSRHRVYAISRQWGLKNANECRAFEEENPIAGEPGESYLSPQNMSRLMPSDPTTWIDDEDEAAAKESAENMRPLLEQTLARVYRRSIQDLPGAEKRNDVSGWLEAQRTFAMEQLEPLFLALPVASHSKPFHFLSPDEARDADPVEIATREAARILGLNDDEQEHA